MYKSTFNYLPSLGVSEVDAALDWSWLVDLGQGNFEAAKIAAEQALLKERNTQTLFARAVVHQLQGEYDRALLLLETAFESTTEIEQKSIIAAMLYLTELRAGEHFPDGFSLNFEAIRLNSVWRQQFQSLKQQVSSPYVQLEGSFIYDIAAVLPNFRVVISKLNSHQSYSTRDDELFSSSEEQFSPPPYAGNEYLEEIKAQLTKQLETYQSLDIIQVVHLLYSVMAELLGLGDATEQAQEILEHLTQACLNSQNYQEAAWYLLSQGDLSTTITVGGSPICFGYRLTNFGTALEPRKTATDLEFAAIHEIYYQARKYFAMAGMRRGEAMAIMRLAYLNALSEQWYLANQGYEEARERFDQLGDRLNAMAAEMGKLWTSAHYEQPESSSIARIEELTRSAKDNGALAWGISWGLAFANSANSALELSDREYNLEAALWCTSLAETIFAIFAEPIQQTGWRSLETYYHFLQAQVLQSAFGFDGVMPRLYAHLTRALVSTENWTEAFTIAEMVRACLLSDFLGKTSVATQSAMASDKSIFIEEIATYLPSQTLLISYLILDKQILAWAVTSMGLVAKIDVRQFGGKPFVSEFFVEEAENWSNNISQGTDRDNWGLNLEKCLLEPLKERIKNSQHIIFIPPVQLNLFPFHNLPWCGQPLGLQKSISYLTTASQLQKFRSKKNNLSSTLIVNAIEGVLIEANHNNQIKQLTSSSIARATAKLIDQFSRVKLIDGQEATKKAVLQALLAAPKIAHLYMQLEDNIDSGIVLAQGEILSQAELANLNLKTDVVFLSIFNHKQRQFKGKKLLGLAQCLIDAGVRTVVVKLWHSDDLATSMFLYFLHQGLADGESLRKSLRQAQRQLCQVSIQQALDFCRDAQAYIAWRQNLDRADRAILTQQIGDLLAFGGNYTRAAEAYQVALKILTEVGYSAHVEALTGKYRYIKSLTNHKIDFNPNLLIYNSPEYWGAFAAIGDWQ
jgi:CHAT domain-containing protein